MHQHWLSLVCLDEGMLPKVKWLPSHKRSLVDHQSTTSEDDPLSQMCPWEARDGRKPRIEGRHQNVGGYRCAFVVGYHILCTYARGTLRYAGLRHIHFVRLGGQGTPFPGNNTNPNRICHSMFSTWSPNQYSSVLGLAASG